MSHIIKLWNVSQFIFKHDDVIKWKHFPRYWPFVRGIHRSPVNSPIKGQWHGALMFFLICVWINGWVNNGETGDLRHHRAHYDVRLMICNNLEKNPWNKISNDNSFFKSSCILLGFVRIRTLPGFIRHGSDSMNDLIAILRNSAIFHWRLCGGRHARLCSVVPVPAWAAAMLCLGAFTSVGIRPAFLTSDQPAPYNENQLTMNLPPPFSPIFFEVACCHQ